MNDREIDIADGAILIHLCKKEAWIPGTRLEEIIDSYVDDDEVDTDDETRCRFLEELTGKVNATISIMGGTPITEDYITDFLEEWG